ncbi:hypothetical protein B5K05_31100 [Rhizobium phaseoli]|nr:hypothetical protein B5K05_31100 [Rhizobium phaseoli]RDJ02186.1 hypothetical protein B5K04_28475 [Rhizobium phaseoli]
MLGGHRQIKTARQLTDAGLVCATLCTHSLAPPAIETGLLPHQRKDIPKPSGNCRAEILSPFRLMLLPAEMSAGLPVRRHARAVLVAR